MRDDNNKGSFFLDLTDGLYKDFSTKAQGKEQSGNMIDIAMKLTGLSIPQLLEKYGLQKRKQKDRFFIPNLGGKPKYVYEYCYPTGEVFGYVCRFEHEGKKTPLPYSNNKWGKSGFPDPTPLYRCHLLSDEKETVVVEGEKTCEFGVRFLGDIFNFTTFQGGTGAVAKSDWSLLEKFKKIYVFPDNDDAGINAANYIGSVLGSKVHIVDVKSLNLPNKWDIADIESNDEEKKREFSREQLIKIIRSAKPYDNILPLKIENKDEFIEEKVFEEIVYDVSPFYKNEYKQSPALKDYFSYVNGFPKNISNNKKLVTINKDGYIYGEKKSSLLLFCFDYFNVASDKNAINAIGISRIDSNQFIKQMKRVKKIENGIEKEEVVPAFFPVKFKQHEIEDALGFYNYKIFQYKVEQFKELVKYNGKSFDEVKKLIIKFIRYALMDPTEAEACAVMIINTVLQIKLKAHGRHEQIPYHSAPVFINKDQGSGKSYFVRALCKCLGDLMIELSTAQIVDPTYLKAMSEKLVVFGDDFERLSGDSLAKFKALSTSHTVSARTYYSQNVPAYENDSTYVFTANTENLGEKVEDETGNRRFSPFLIKTFRNVDFLPEDLEELKPLYIDENPTSVFPIYPFDKMNLTYLWQCVDENWGVEKWYLNELESVKVVQKKHATKTKFELFVEQYEIEFGGGWAPFGQITQIFNKDFRVQIDPRTFSKNFKKMFTEQVFTAKKRLHNGRPEAALYVSFNSALSSRLEKEGFDVNRFRVKEIESQQE